MKVANPSVNRIACKLRLQVPPRFAPRRPVTSSIY